MRSIIAYVAQNILQCHATAKTDCKRRWIPPPGFSIIVHIANQIGKSMICVKRI